MDEDQDFYLPIDEDQRDKDQPIDAPIAELLKDLHDQRLRTEDLVARARSLGQPALAALETELSKGGWRYENDFLKRVTRMLASLGEPGVSILRNAMGSYADNVARHAAIALGTIGSVGVRALTEALGSSRRDVRIAAVKGLGSVGEEAIPALVEALSDDDSEVVKEAVERLLSVGEPAYESLERLVLGDNREARRAFSSLVGDIVCSWDLGDWLIRLIIAATEDNDFEVGEDARNGLYLAVFRFDWPLNRTCATVIQEQVVRTSGWPSERFKPDNTTTVLQKLSAPTNSQSRVYEMLCNAAFEYDGAIRCRAVDVARGLGASQFAPLVKARAEQNPKVAAEIMDRLGGEESTAFFTKQQSQTLEQYRAPLVELEKTSRERWEDLTKQARTSFRISMGMSIALFVVGTAIIGWGLWLVTSSQELQQLIAGGLLTAAAGLATTYSGRFWKDPVEHIQRFSAQQARLQTAFIGYMNRIAQLRLVFEQDYADEGVPLDALEAYQRLLGDAIDQASRQLTVVEGAPKSE